MHVMPDLRRAIVLVSPWRLATLEMNVATLMPFMSMYYTFFSEVNHSKAKDIFKLYSHLSSLFFTYAK